MKCYSAIVCAVLMLGSVASAEKVRIAMMHGVPVKWGLEENFKVFLEQVEVAAKKKVDVMITPECWLDGYAAPDKGSTPEKLKAVAQDLEESPYLKQVAALAKKHKMQICFGFSSLEEGLVYNTAGLWDVDGSLIGIYHKNHLQTHDLQYSYGEGLPVFDAGKLGTVGMMICADRRWPETVRTMRLKGAKLILNPTYGFWGDMNTAIMRTRSFENQCFIAFTHPQNSLVTGPKGQIVYEWEGDGEAGVKFCTIDLSEAKDNNHLQDRRPELYGVIAESEE